MQRTGYRQRDSKEQAIDRGTAKNGLHTEGQQRTGYRQRDSKEPFLWWERVSGDGKQPL